MGWRNTDFQSGFLDAIMGNFKSKEEQAAAYQKAYQEALATKQIEERFPSPEDQAKTQILTMADQAGRLPMRPVSAGADATMASPSTQNNMAAFQQAQQAAPDNRLKYLSYLTGHAGATNQPINAYYFDPQTGQVQIAPGGQNLPARSRVLPLHTTPEEAGQISAARTSQSLAAKSSPEGLAAARNISRASAEGAAAGTPLNPQQSAFEQGFVDLLKSVNRASTLIGNTPPGQFNQKLFATGLPGQPGAGELSLELGNAADLLLRLRSGAQINEREFSRLRGLLPQGRDAIKELMGNPGLAQQKLERFRQTAQDIMHSKRTRANQPGTNSSEDLSQLSDEELHAIMAGQ